MHEDLVAKIYDNVREKDVRSAVNNCVRLAKNNNDILGVARFLLQQDQGSSGATRSLLNFKPHLTAEEVEAILTSAMEYLKSTHSITKADGIIYERVPNSVWPNRAGSLDNDIKGCDDELSVIELPPGLSPQDTANFFLGYREERLILITKRNALERLKERILALCYNYANDIEIQQTVLEQGKSAVIEMEEQVLSFLREVCPDAFTQYSDASSSLNSSEPEKISSGMLSLRRCLKSLADCLQPADRKIEALGKDKYLNRLSYFLEKQQREKACFSPQTMEKILKNINDLACKGVHSSTSQFEANQTLIGTLLYLHQLSEAYQAFASN